MNTPPLVQEAHDPNVLTISRVAVNYAVIAITCFIVGAVVGVFGYDRIEQSNRTENSELINGAVAAVVAALPQSPTAVPTLDPNIRYNIDEAGNPTIGPEDALVTIIEFGDFHCRFCKSFVDNTLDPLLDTYEGRVRFVFRDYPILGDSSVQAALAGECADDQDQFWAYHDLLYTGQDLTRVGFVQYATELGMDLDAFNTCLDDVAHQADIEADYRAGAQLGVTGTPTFFINGKMFVGAQPYENFVAAIEAELNNPESVESTPTLP